jgi:hypothetical protein
MMGAGPPWRPAPDGLLVRVRVTPRAAHDAIEGVEATPDGPALKARVRAVPADGAANAAVARLLADWLDVARSSVGLAAGARSRVKTLLVAGHPTALAARAAGRLSKT